MSSDKHITLRMDPRLHKCAVEAHARFNEQMFEDHGLPASSFNTFLEVCINEYLSINASDLHRVAFDKTRDAS